MNASGIDNINKTCLEDGTVEDLPLGLLVKMLGIFSFLLGRLGNVFILGIVHYEKFGQDPQKRYVAMKKKVKKNFVICMSILNIFILLFRHVTDRIFNFNCLLFIFCSIITNSIILIRTFLGPLYNAVALLRYYIGSTMLSIPLGTVL